MATIKDATLQEQRSPAYIWSLSVRKIVYMAIGAALYGVLSVPTNFVQLPNNITIRPAIVIPIFFGAVFGPLVGLFAGGVGNILGDFISGFGFNWNWDVGNALIGFIAGLTMYVTWGRYLTRNQIITASVIGAVAVLVGIAFAAYTDMFVTQSTVQNSTLEFLTGGLPDMVLGLVLLPILIVAYNATLSRLGRTAL